MKFQTVWLNICLLILTILGFNLSIQESNAQTKVKAQDELDVAIDDQARYLQNLESRSASQWSFPNDGNAQTPDNYELSVSTSEVRLTEQKPPEWGNTGDDPNYSVLVDIYDFTETTDN